MLLILSSFLNIIDRSSITEIFVVNFIRVQLNNNEIRLTEVLLTPQRFMQYPSKIIINYHLTEGIASVQV